MIFGNQYFAYIQYVSTSLYIVFIAFTYYFEKL